MIDIFQWDEVLITSFLFKMIKIVIFIKILAGAELVYRGIDLVKG